MTQDQLKQLVGQKAVEYIKDGMQVGLGTGSTVKFMVDAPVSYTHLTLPTICSV